MTKWEGIVSFISYEQIAECLEIDTNNEFVADGQITPDGMKRIFDLASEENLSEDDRVKRENELMQQAVIDYIPPEEVVKKVRWATIFEQINTYTQRGSRHNFLSDLQTGPALDFFETEEGISVTFHEPIMIFINDAQYAEDSTLPEFGFDDLSATDLFIAIDQASQAEMLDASELEPLAEFTS